MNAAVVLLLLAIVAVPVLLGAAAAYLRKPWWWAAVAAVVLFLAAAILPEPEAGEPRVAAGDLGFLAVVCAVVVLLVWLGALLGRRVAHRRSVR